MDTRRRRRRQVLAGILAVLGICLLAAGWLALRARDAHTHLRAAAVAIPQLRQQLAAGDLDAARGTLTDLQRHAAAARADTDDLVWRVSAYVPGVGRQVAAVTGIARAVDELARHALPPLVDVAGTADPAALAPKRGRIDLTTLADAAPNVARAHTAMRAARDRLAGIDPDGLHPTLAAAVVDLRGRLDDAEATTATVERATTLLPPMLGADGPRTYLVMFQNLAEVRATGGMFGAYAVVRADRGEVRMLEQHTAGDRFARPVVTLDPAAKALYTERPAVFPADVNFTPDFPTAAALAREMYHRRHPHRIDGVLATDPVALSYLLAGTGPVRLPDGASLTAGNAVHTLLSDAYARIGSPEEQDRFFAGAARSTFTALARGRGTPRATLAGLARAAGERRLLIWSAHPAEQRLLRGTVLAGELPAEDGSRPTVGIFLNDGTGAKLGYYLRQSADLEAGRCRSDGLRELRLRMTLRSVAPATGLPSAVLGWRRGTDLTTVQTNVMVFSPTGGAVADVAVDGRPVFFGSGTERGRAVGVITVRLPPGARRSLDVSLLTGVVPWNTEPVPVELRTTPTVAPWTLRSAALPPCRAE